METYQNIPIKIIGDIYISIDEDEEYEYDSVDGDEECHEKYDENE